jgi:hypothetical protein
VGFLNAIFLTGLIAAAVPVVIHLLNRRRIRRIRFSSLEFLTELARRRMRKINLRRILILVLRTLAVVFVVVAFARPTLRGAAFLLPGKAPKNVVICLDASYSMGVHEEQGTAFTEAKRVAAAIADEAGKHDAINLVLFSGRADVQLDQGTRNKALIKTTIGKTAPTAETTSIQRAIDEAYELIDRSDITGGEIYVVSDFRYNADSTLVGTRPDRRDVRLFFVPVNEESVDNVSIDRVMVPRKLLRPGEVIRIGVAVSNHSLENPADFPLELTVEGRRKAEKVINLSRGASTTVTFPISFAEWGTYRCRVSKNHDRLPIDDDRYFLLEVSKSVPVTLIRGRRRLDGGSGAAGGTGRGNASAGGIESAAGFFYLEKALNPRSAGDGEFTVRTIDEKDITEASLPVRGVTVWVNPTTLQPKRLALLERYVSRGGGLMLFLGNGGRRLLQDKNFRDFIGVRTATQRTNQAKKGYTSFEQDHPVFRMFNDEELELLTRTQVRTYVSVQGVSPDSVLAYVAGGDPAVWECARGKGRVLVFAAAPDLESGDIPLSPMFLPLVHTSVSYLASAGVAQRRQEHSVGEQLYFDAPQSALGSSQLMIRDPEGTPLRPVVFETPNGDRRAICERPREVGFYRLMTDTTVVAEAVVNLDTRESNIAVRSLPDKELDAASVVTTGGDFLKNLQASRQGREIFGLFIFLAAAALAAESILGRRA